MKKIYLLITLFLLNLSYSQIVSIPDANFKSYLINFLGVDTNTDGEIQEVEALAITQLVLSSSSITNLEGIQSFSNVNYIFIINISATTINITELTQLDWLEISGCPLLTTITINAPLLNKLIINNTGLESIDISNSPNINECNLSNNNLVSFTGSSVGNINLNNNNLTSFNCNQLNGDIVDLSNNQLVSFNYIFNGSELYLNDNLLTSINFPNITFFENEGFLNISNNSFTTLDLTGFEFPRSAFTCNSDVLTSVKMPTPEQFNFGPVPTVTISGENLSFIDFKNGFCDVEYSLSGMPIFNGGYNFQINGSPDLFICVDEGCGSYSNSNNSYRDEEFYFSHLGLFGDATLPVDTPRSKNASPYCSSIPGGEFNTISGNVKLDCGNLNYNLPNIKLNFSPQNNYTFSNESGNFIYYLGQGSGIISPQLENPNYFIVTPNNYTYNFSNAGNTQLANFCLTPNGVHSDLETTLVPIFVARPGFDAKYKLIVKNKGNQIESGTVSFLYNNTILDFINSSLAVSSQTSNTLFWDFSTLQPFEKIEIEITFNLNSPMETPAVNNGDVLSFTSLVTTAQTDETPSNNSFSLNQLVVGSFDPNDKLVLEGSQLDISKSGDYLTYRIRFQNVGDFMAENIVVKDYLTSNLDKNTLQVVDSSHPFRTTLSQSNRLEFFFDGINLPTESSDELASQGYIVYKIKPISNISIGTNIENNALIYFDYNNPIKTNTVSTTYSLLGNNDISFDENFSLSPNPASNFITIFIKNQIDVKIVEIYNLQGQLLLKSSLNNEADLLPINVSDLREGVYMINIITDDRKKSSKRFIKR